MVRIYILTFIVHFMTWLSVFKGWYVQKILFECASFITWTKKRSESESYSATIVWNNPVYKINISDPEWTGSLLSFAHAEDKNTYKSL